MRETRRRSENQHTTSARLADPGTYNIVVSSDVPETAALCVGIPLVELTLNPARQARRGPKVKLGECSSIVDEELEYAGRGGVEGGGGISMSVVRQGKARRGKSAIFR